MKTNCIHYLSIVLSLQLLLACSAQSPTYNWDGSWDSKAYDADNFYNCKLELLTSAEKITGTYECLQGFIKGTFDGSLSADHSTASGNYLDNLGNGTFEWRLLSTNTDQFNGNNSGSWAWCGARAGTPLPDPCLGP